MTITLNQDYDRELDFRRLSQLIPPELATHVFLCLFAEFGHQAESRQLGIMGKGDWDYFAQETLRRAANPSNVTPDDLRKHLIEVGLLVDEGDHYFCNRFVQTNYYRSREYRGSRTVRTDNLYLANRLKRYKNMAAQDVLCVPPGSLAEVDGVATTPQERNRCVVLVRMIDAITGRGERDKNDWPKTMLEDACRLVRRLDEGQMLAFLMRFKNRCAEKGLSRSTPRILANIDKLLQFLRPEEGWDSWAKGLQAVQQIQSSEGEARQA